MFYRDTYNYTIACYTKFFAINISLPQFIKLIAQFDTIRLIRIHRSHSIALEFKYDKLIALEFKNNKLIALGLKYDKLIALEFKYDKLIALHFKYTKLIALEFKNNKLIALEFKYDKLIIIVNIAIIKRI